jgi:hypothetical protein
MYNLALANHLDGLQRQCIERLRRAVTYYEASYKLQMHQSLVLSVVHGMSILNNIGTIYQVLNDQQASNKFFQRLLSTMTCLRDSGVVDSTEKSWNGFWSNVTSLMLTITCAAAAA